MYIYIPPYQTFVLVSCGEEQRKARPCLCLHEHLFVSVLICMVSHVYMHLCVHSYGNSSSAWLDLGTWSCSSLVVSGLPGSAAPNAEKLVFL